MKSYVSLGLTGENAKLADSLRVTGQSPNSTVTNPQSHHNFFHSDKYKSRELFSLGHCDLNCVAVTCSVFKMVWANFNLFQPKLGLL